jgi:Fic family protein
MAYTPQFTITPLLLEHAEHIAALRERIHAHAVDYARLAALQSDARARNVHASTAIEGNPLSLEQVLTLASGQPRVINGKTPRSKLCATTTSSRCTPCLPTASWTKAKRVATA